MKPSNYDKDLAEAYGRADALDNLMNIQIAKKRNELKELEQSQNANFEKLMQLKKKIGHRIQLDKEIKYG